MSQLSWHVALAMTIALSLIFGGVISILYAMYKAEKQDKRLRSPNHIVGRDVYSEFRGARK